MALTISQQPQAWTPAYNDQYITALSDEIAQPNFKYLVEVSIDYDLNGTPTNITYSYQFLPRPDGYLVFNAKEIVKNYIQHFIKPLDYDILECVNSRVEVGITIIEDWTGVVTPDTETINYNAWNASLTEKKFYSSIFDYTFYISNNFNIRIFTVDDLNLLSIPFEKQTLKADVFLQFVKPSDLDTIYYTLVDTDGATDLNTIALSGTMTNDKIYQINVSPQLAEETWGGVTEGMYIRVDFFKATPDIMYTYLYEIKHLCTKHEVNRIYYLNRRGGISSFPFEMLSTQTIDNKTSEVRLGRNYIDTGVYTYKPYQHEANIVSTEETYMKSLQTNWLTTQQMIYLEELFSSPLKWLVNEEDVYGSLYNYVPVTMINKPYLLNKHENEKLFNYGIDVKFSTQETRQRAI